MREDLVEVRLEFVDLGLGELQVGQIGHVPHFFFRNLHARAFVRAAL